MKRSKRTLALLLMLVMLVSALTVGVSAEYSPLSGSYSGTRYLTPSGYSEEELAAFPVKDFLEQLTDSSGNARPVSADKIAWSRDGSDNYTVSDAETGTIDLRFNGQTNLYGYMVAGSGKMLDMNGNTRYRVVVAKEQVFSKLTLLFVDKDGQKQEYKRQSWSRNDYNYGSYTAYNVDYRTDSKETENLCLRAKFALAADSLKLYDGQYTSVKEAEGSRKEIETTAVDDAYDFTVQDGYNKICVVTENGGVKKLSNIQINIDRNYGFFDYTVLKDGKSVSAWYSRTTFSDGTGKVTIGLESSSNSADAEYALKMEYYRQFIGNSGVED